MSLYSDTLSNKVLYLIVATAMGGAERLFYNAVEEKDNMPCVQYAAIYAYRGDPKNNELRRQGVHIFNEIKPGRQRLSVLYYHHKVAVQLLKYIRCERIRIVHAHDTYTMLYGLLAKWLLGIKVIRTYHGSRDSYWAAENAIFRVFRKWIDYNVFVSHSYMKRFHSINRLAPDKLKCGIVYNGVKVKESYTLIDESQDCYPRIVMVGNYTGGRNHFFVLRVFKELLLKYPNALLTLIGNDNPKEPSLYGVCVSFIRQNQLSDKVRMISGITDVVPYLRQSDLFLYDSKRDTFGIALVEAVLCGVPSLVNDLDTFVEVSDNGRLCYLYRTGDMNDCIAQAINLVDDMRIVRNRAAVAKKYAADRYSMEEYARNLMGIYMSIERSVRKQENDKS